MRDGFIDAAVGILAAVFGLVALVGVIFGLWAGVAAFARYQKRANAANKVRVTNTYVRVQQQEARRVAARDAVIKALADQRVIEAEGIRKAQDLIAKTLTPLYVQHEAIQAQRAAGNASERVYIPVGPQGIPLVNNVGK